MGLTPSADRPLRQYSRGMLQRVGIAQALVNDPDLVFLDEPMLGLDPVGRYEVRRIILGLRERGTTLCFSTHVLSDAESLCDRVAVLNQGKLHGLGQLDELLELRASTQEILTTGVAPERLGALGPRVQAVRRAGDTVALQVASGELYVVIGQLRELQATILSVTPVRASLEDYFFEAFGTVKQPERMD